MLTTILRLLVFKRTCGQHYLPSKKLEPKTKRFDSGDFMRFCQNVTFNFSTRSRRKSKFLTHGVLNGNCHTSFTVLRHSRRVSCYLSFYPSLPKNDQVSFAKEPIQKGVLFQKEPVKKWGALSKRDLAL